MNEKNYITPDAVAGEEIKNVRNSLGLTQKEFANLIGCSKPTVERWETSSSPVKGPIVLLLQYLKDDPGYIQKIEVPSKAYPLRLWYMHDQTVCTIIDVDESRQRIRIKNYAKHIMFRAFGKIEDPDYDMYMDFIESRCFPRSRDKMKLILQDLDLPFYDPLMIIEKTEGRRAEDHFWIRIER